MPEPISKVQRWLDLIAYLVGRHFPVSVEDLMERLPAYAGDWREGDETVRASVRRKFERDKDELRELGIPLETVTYRINYGMEEAQGYRISRRDFYLPYLRLLRRELNDIGSRREGDSGAATDAMPRASAPDRSLPAAARDFFTVGDDGSMGVDEAVAEDAVWGLKELADLPGFPLAASARSALRKFTFDLDPDSFSREKVHYAVPPETVRAGEHLDTLSDALLRRKTVTFTYHGIQRNQTTVRNVRPYGLLYKHSHWYMVGWDEGRDAERIFRVDRMEQVGANPAAPATPDYEMPEESVLERYRDREAWELGEAEDTVQALVRFQFPASLWADRNEHGELVRQVEDGASLRRFEIRQPDPFLRWILSQRGEAVIESPAALAEALKALARQVGDLYREDADG